MGCKEYNELDVALDEMQNLASQQIQNYIRDDIIGNGGKIIK